jgi:hypothetical protein
MFFGWCSLMRSTYVHINNPLLHCYFNSKRWEDEEALIISLHNGFRSLFSKHFILINLSPLQSAPTWLSMINKNPRTLQSLKLIHSYPDSSTTKLRGCFRRTITNCPSLLEVKYQESLFVIKNSKTLLLQWNHRVAWSRQEYQARDELI